MVVGPDGGYRHHLIMKTKVEYETDILLLGVYGVVLAIKGA